MKKHKFLTKIISCCLLNLIFFSSLSSCKPKAQNFGADADYFIGLQKLSAGNTKEASAKFKHCVKKGTYYCARKSAQALTEIGNIQEKNEACLNLVKQFPDSESKLIAVTKLFSTQEINKVIELTEKLDFETENNQLIKIRLEAMLKRKDSRFMNEIFRWFMTKPISQEHYQFYRDTYIPLFENDDTENPEKYAIDYRILIYRRNYLEAYDKAEQMFTYFADNKLNFFPYLASDIGKAYLYGNDRFTSNAEYFRKQAEIYKGTPAEFYLWFYAGRFYDMAALYYKQSIFCYNKAVESTENSEKKDNALWYLLKSKSKYSLDETLKDISIYAKQWSNPEYFDDFFDNLIPSLLVSGKWGSFEKLLNNIDGYASNEICARLAYIYGRLLEEGYISEENVGIKRNQAFERALKCGTATYYKLLAAYRLQANNKQLSQIITQPCDSAKNKTINTDTAAETLLKGYAHFGFPEKIYPEWQKLYKDKISTETSMYLSAFLQKCGEQNHKYYAESLRIAARSGNITPQSFTVENLKLIYPENYNRIVEKYCQEYDIDESVMYALIRSESFFDADIESTAGASGLTQLMELTAGDIARKLKIKEYSLTDPDTNVRFGTFYLAELNRRCENNMLNAFFSYNAGITKVRNWLNSSMVEFGKRNNMSGDLFLETIPYSETREYGRKLVNATIMYEYLYGTKDFYETVKGLIK